MYIAIFSFMFVSEIWIHLDRRFLVKLLLSPTATRHFDSTNFILCWVIHLRTWIRFHKRNRLWYMLMRTRKTSTVVCSTHVVKTMSCLYQNLHIHLVFCVQHTFHGNQYLYQEFWIFIRYVWWLYHFFNTTFSLIFVLESLYIKHLLWCFYQKSCIVLHLVWCLY